MSYTRPTASAANATWQGTGTYTRPAAGAADATFPSASFDTSIAAVVPVTASIDLVHGVAVTIAAIVPVQAAIDAEYVETNIDTDIVALVPVVASMDLVHGVAATIIAVVPVGAAMSGAHGVNADVVGIVPVAASIAAVHERYELSGEVRLAGVLVNRRVRAYRRSDGAFVAEADTVVGRFKVPAGFVSTVEHYVVPIHLDAGATDWSPPVANRVLPVLAMDA